VVDVGVGQEEHARFEVAFFDGVQEGRGLEAGVDDPASGQALAPHQVTVGLPVAEDEGLNLKVVAHGADDSKTAERLGSPGDVSAKPTRRLNGGRTCLKTRMPYNVPIMSNRMIQIAGIIIIHGIHR
jgi:hypothetical protein